MELDWTIKFTDIAIVLAMLLSPFLAVHIQRRLDEAKEVKERRMWIFRVLMATRAARLSPNHVEALNSVPIEFYGNSESLQGITDKWKSYIDHMGATVGEGGMSQEVWNKTCNDLFFDLLHLMSKFLGYKFNLVELSKEVYSPKGHHWIESDQEIIRRGLAKMFTGDFSIPMDVRSFPVDNNALIEQEQIRKATLKWLAGDSAVGIEIKKGDKSLPT